MAFPVVLYVGAGRLAPFAGRSFLWWVWIDERYKMDQGLFKHEEMHYMQFIHDPLFHSIKYRFSAHYRYKCELEAYKVQLSYSITHASDAELFTKFILKRYNLDKLALTEIEVKKELLA